MMTKAVIGIWNQKEDTVDYMVVNRYGYPEHTGVMLIKEYNKLDKIRNLIKHGAMKKVPVEPETIIPDYSYKVAYEDFIDVNHDLGMDEDYRFLYDVENAEWLCIDLFYYDIDETDKMPRYDEVMIDLYVMNEILTLSNGASLLEILASRKYNTYLEFRSYLMIKFLKKRGGYDVK